MTDIHHINGTDRETPPLRPLSLVKDTDTPTAPAAESRARRARRAVKAAATHEKTRAVARTAARHGLYVYGGARILTKRAWDSRTTAEYQRMIRAAAAVGDHEQIKEHQVRREQFRQARHFRRMQLLTAPQQLAKSTLHGAGLAGGLVLGLGVLLAIANDNPADVTVPAELVIDIVRWAFIIAAVVWTPALLAAPWLGLAALWNTGRRQQAAPNWALPAGQRPDEQEMVPDESAILKALQHLSIGSLTRAFKDGWQPRWVAPTTRLGNGWHSQLQLPLGVTVEMIGDKKHVLAHNLLRKPVEVWPTEPHGQPGVLDLWVADQGSLSGPVPPWPLLTEGTTDYFKGVPAGLSQRGEPVAGKLMAANYMVGGIMGVGKSSLVVSLLLGAMLDPLVEIEVYVMAYNVDYDPMRPRLATLVKGDEDEQAEAALKALRNLRDEVTERGKLLADLGGEEVRLTRDLAERDPRMRPKVVVFDECHELFMHKKYGKEAAELAVKVMKKARKVGITLIWVTVSPTADSIPKDVTRNTSHRVAFAVGDHIANDGLLGTGKHKAGITATTLNPAEDIGTALTVGFNKNPFELIRSYYVRKDASTDEVTPVVQRAVALREGIAAPARPAAEPVDELADIGAVFGDAARMRTDEVRQRLAERNPAHYREWTASDLTRALEGTGAEPYKSHGIMVISRTRILEALAERADNTTDDYEE
jgi:S-DNA-T family DNA segregation ATPase FtsK/SpoIIIE